MNHDPIAPSRRILIIDDNPSIHADFQKILSAREAASDDLRAAEHALFGAGTAPKSAPVRFELTSAYQGREGVERLREACDRGEPFAMAFVDVRMPPGMDGIETAARLWEIDPDLQIVICTAYTDYSWEEMTARLDPGDRMVLLKKPFEMIEVLQLAGALTAKWMLQSQARLRLLDLEDLVRARTRELEASNAQLARMLEEERRAAAEREELEARLRQAQKLESIGQLAGGIAHDFNNLLMVILGHVDLLGLAESLPAEVDEALGEIRGAAERAGTLTRQLLAFGRRQVLQQKPLDANGLVRDLTNLLRRTLGEHIAIETRLDPDLAPIVADRDMIEQVLMNLAVNARDAMPDGGRLTLSTEVRTLDESESSARSDAQPGRYVVLSVADTGAGIREEHLPRVFEPFFTTKETGKGSGLGLATAYGIVRQHDGWIDVDSHPSKGATFQVHLPANGKAAPANSRVAPKTATIPAGKSILLVEDEQSLRSLLTATLKRQTYTVHACASGAEALREWGDRLDAIDLLITDIVMPEGVSGWDLAQAFLARNPALPVIYMSGYNKAMTTQDTALDGETRFLQKPFGVQQLTALVRDCLGRNMTRDGTRAAMAAVSRTAETG
jgi:two-component system, NtrC family, sensor kinase